MIAVLFAPALPEPALDSAVRGRVVTAAAKHLREKYVLPGLGDTLASALERARNSGAHDHIINGPELAARLTADLQSVSHDKHLRITYSAERSKPTPSPTLTSVEERRERITRLGGEVNYGFRRAEILSGNIGYLAIDGFWHLEFGGGDTAAAAMAFVARTDALIIDLRESSNGGDPEMSILLSSYFFPDQVHLSDMYSRLTNDTRQWWTLAYVPGRRYIDKPVYVLTSKATFSAGEGFAYDLQSLRRATVIGETTAGAAHPEEEYLLTDNFSIDIPFARSINAVTKTDWEGTGVHPDLPIEASAALDTARLEALKKLINQPASARVADERKKLWQSSSRASGSVDDAPAQRVIRDDRADGRSSVSHDDGTSLGGGSGVECCLGYYELERQQCCPQELPPCLRMTHATFNA